MMILTRKYLVFLSQLFDQQLLHHWPQGEQQQRNLNQQVLEVVLSVINVDPYLLEAPATLNVMSLWKMILCKKATVLLEKFACGTLGKSQENPDPSSGNVSHQVLSLDHPTLHWCPDPNVLPSMCLTAIRSLPACATQTCATPTDQQMRSNLMCCQ